MVVEVSPWARATTLGRMSLTASSIVSGAKTVPHSVSIESHLAARAFGDLAQEMAEATEHGDQHPVARRDQRDQNRLDSGPRGAVDQERPAIGGLEQPPQERHGFVHVGGEGRVELAQQRHGHGAQHAGIGVDRPRAQQKPGWRI